MKQELDERKDNIQFRILYFLGIIFIVSGHGGGGLINLFSEWFPVYSFHLALFVFCSGYFFINNKDKKIIIVLKKLVTKFLIPLYAWNIFYGLLLTILHRFGIQFGQSLSFESLFILPIYSGHQFILNLASWFIWPLVILQFINIFVIKILKKNENLYYLYFIISLILGFIGVQLAINGYYLKYYLLLVKVLYFLPFFSLGMLYRVKLEKKDNLSNLWYFGIIFIISLIMLYFYGHTIGYAISSCQNFDNFYRPFIAGFLGIAFWLRVSKILVPALKDSKIVKKISNNTFSIMMHHLTGFFILSTIYYLLSRYTNLVNNFNVELYKTSICYFYLPAGFYHFSLLYGIAGFSYSFLVIFIMNKIKSFLKQIFHFMKKNIVNQH